MKLRVGGDQPPLPRDVRPSPPRAPRERSRSTIRSRRRASSVDARRSRTISPRRSRRSGSRMSRRNNASRAAARAAACTQSLCVCALIPAIETRTRLVLVIHRAEDRKPTNTGRLAAHCLVEQRGRRARARGRSRRRRSSCPPGRSPLFLFPHEDAVPLESDRAVASARSRSSSPTATGDKPRRCGTACRAFATCRASRSRPGALRSIGCAPRRTSTGSRRSRRSRARWGILEGDDTFGARSSASFRAMVERTLWARGESRDARRHRRHPRGRDAPRSDERRPRSKVLVTACRDRSSLRTRRRCVAACRGFRAGRCARRIARDKARARRRADDRRS